MKRRGVVRVRVPNGQAPVFHVPGEHGGWFISLLYSFGTNIDVSTDELGKLLAGSRGTVIVARRLVGAELRLFEQYRGDSDAEIHGTIINKEELRFRRSRRATRGTR